MRYTASQGLQLLPWKETDPHTDVHWRLYNGACWRCVPSCDWKQTHKGQAISFHHNNRLYPPITLLPTQWQMGCLPKHTVRPSLLHLHDASYFIRLYKSASLLRALRRLFFPAFNKGSHQLDILRADHDGRLVHDDGSYRRTRSQRRHRYSQRNVCKDSYIDMDGLANNKHGKLLLCPFPIPGAVCKLCQLFMVNFSIPNVL